MFLGYIVSQLFCIYGCATCHVISPMYINNFHNLCALPSMAVFCSSLILCFPSILLRYCQSDFGIVPLLLVSLLLSLSTCAELLL